MSNGAKDLTKQVTVNGVEYTLQRMAVRPGMEMRQRWNVNGIVDDVKMIDELFENVVIDPRIKLDDFDTESEATEIAAAALDFQFPSRGK